MFRRWCHEGQVEQFLIVCTSLPWDAAYRSWRRETTFNTSLNLKSVNAVKSKIANTGRDY